MGTGRTLRIIVLGYIVRGPLGGMAWHPLQYVLGLARLGHDVWLFEDSDDYPSCYDPVRGVTDTDPTYGLAFTANTFNRVGLGDRWAYFDAHTDRWLGPAAGGALSVFETADLLFNISGVNPLRPWALEVPVRVLIDTDPVFTQIRHLTNPTDRELAGRHNAFFSFGENIEVARSNVPDDGIKWQATRQPMVLDQWPVTPGPPSAKFTTVMQWDSYPAQEYNGQRFGMKSESFGPFIDLPTNAGRQFELALGSPSAPRSELVEHGWTIRNPLEITRDPWVYQDYIRASKAEFGVAKHGYVVANTGWFSERSAAYLASGRPVVAHNTGFTDWLPTGDGVLSFRTPEEALAAIEDVNRRYAAHCRAAREIAKGYFDSRIVLASLIERTSDAITS
jgi:hypothetical protein